ncbi:MAG: hypothetical protein QM775_34595 [Pirellulales bacterium]
MFDDRFQQADAAVIPRSSAAEPIVELQRGDKIAVAAPLRRVQRHVDRIFASAQAGRSQKNAAVAMPATTSKSSSSRAAGTRFQARSIR